MDEAVTNEAGLKPALGEARATGTREKIAPPFKTSPPEEVFKVIIRLVDEASLNDYYESRLTPSSQREPVSAIIGFLNSPEFQVVLGEQWQYQADPKAWLGRSDETTFEETLDSAFTILGLRASSRYLDFSEGHHPPEEASRAEEEYSRELKRIELIHGYLKQRGKSLIQPQPSQP